MTVLLLLSLATSAVSAQGNETNETMSIIGVAEEDGNFTTLLTALEAANLTDALNETGPFTVFAPTDDAFDALPEGTLEALLNNSTELREVLLYHVASGRLTSEEVANQTNITTLQGSRLPVNVTEDGVFVGDAEIIMTDINASNGVIHAIDAVLIPPKPAQNLTVLYNDTVNLTEGNFTFKPENSTKTYEIGNFTDFGALNATGLQYNVSVWQNDKNMSKNENYNETHNMNNVSFRLQSIEGIRNNNTTGERWFTYVNEMPVNRSLGMNNVSLGDKLSFLYTTWKDGKAVLENATYVANITIAEEMMVPEGNQTEDNQTEDNQLEETQPEKYA